MVLRLASDEAREVQKALSAAYSDILRQLGRAPGFLSPEPGLELCRRKWKLEAVLRQLDHPEDPAVLELVPASARPVLQEEAA